MQKKDFVKIFLHSVKILKSICVGTIKEFPNMYLSAVFTFSYIYEGHTISFQTFFVWAFKIVVDSWKMSMLLLDTLWDDWPICMISGSNEQLQHELEYTLLKPDCYSWWISKMQSDTLEGRYAMKFCFKLGKNATKTHGITSDCFLTILHESIISFRVT